MKVVETYMVEVYESEVTPRPDVPKTQWRRKSTGEWERRQFMRTWVPVSNAESVRLEKERLDRITGGNGTNVTSIGLKKGK